MRRLRIVVAVASCFAVVALSGGAVVAQSASATSGNWTSRPTRHLPRITMAGSSSAPTTSRWTAPGTRSYGTAHEADFAGVALSGRSGVTVKNCHSSPAASGRASTSVNGNEQQQRLSGNTASGNNGWAGLISLGSSGNTLIGNTATDNHQPGVCRAGQGTASNTLEGNTASRNGSDGFHLQAGTTNNTLNANTASGNGYMGFGLYEPAQGTRSPATQPPAQALPGSIAGDPTGTRSTATPPATTSGTASRSRNRTGAGMTHNTADRQRPERVRPHQRCIGQPAGRQPRRAQRCGRLHPPGGRRDRQHAGPQHCP